MRPYSLHTCQLLNVLRQLLKHFFIQTFFFFYSNNFNRSCFKAHGQEYADNSEKMKNWPRSTIIGIIMIMHFFIG